MLANIVKRNCYHDSVFLMSIAAQVREMEGVSEVSCVMGTPENLEIAERSGILDETGRTAGQNDLLIAVRAASQEALDAALSAAQRLLDSAAGGRSQGSGRAVARSLGDALRRMPDANLAVISVPGRYAAAEADKALDAGMHVFLFSDNVSVEQEISLKEKASRKGLLVMGPDCGTSILAGAAIGFANVVRRGNIGIVAASGTGLQEVSSLIHQGGGGISHGIGTGGRDLSQKVGALTTRAAIALLQADDETQVIVVVSKPPAPSVAEQVLALLENGPKPCVVNFVGTVAQAPRGHVRFASTLEDAAIEALKLSGTGSPTREIESSALALDALSTVVPCPSPKRVRVRALYSGGTLCDEAQAILNELLDEPVWSNTPLSPEWKLADSTQSLDHTVVDLGDDEFTVGRPHPMIDFTLRNDRIMQEVADRDTGVILLDVVLGYGSHPDPASALAEPLRAAHDARIPVLVHLCGTDLDPQGLSRQASALEAVGAVVLYSNAAAATLAAELSKKIPDT